MPSRRAGWRRWLYRLAAIVLGLSPLLGFEVLCRVFDWGRPALHDDPFVGFSSIRPLFVLSDDRSRYEIPAARQRFFCAESFPARKLPGDFRIFCLGGSTVQGRPFATETSYTSWLEITLNAAQPDRHWDVINCGGVSYASYRLIPILHEVLTYQPDLIILDTGHNEFLEARSFDHLQDRGAAVNAALSAAARLRTFTLIREQYLRLNGKSSAAPSEGRPLLPEEVDALLDYQNGLEEYRRDEAWRDGVVKEFEFHLRELVQIAQDAGVPMLLVNPCSNLRDFPPIKSLHRDNLTKQELAEWDALCAAAGVHMDAGAAELPDAIACLEQACRIDPEHALSFYHLGHCYLAAQRTADARRMFEQALALDICPLRMLKPMSESLLRVARETGTPCVDAQALFESLSRDGLVGDQWLVDHVHPSIAGHQVFADALADKFIELQMAVPVADWAERKVAGYREHLDSLPDLYFLKGMQRLESEQHWAHGRATLVRPGSGPPAPAPLPETGGGE
ncbi:MAG: hypothetical protein JNG89_07640 [Planctomycetaceae bacterium]|nr:hypothetical protein [Planctomycetaceae bacterium]